MPVVVDNDANVAVVGELAHGAARGCDDVVLVTLGTGVGGGIVVNGTVLRGAHGFGAEIGHFQVDPDGPMCACGERGHWEAVASGTALGALGRARAQAGEAPALLARAMGAVDAIDGTMVGDAAQDGDAGALAVVREYAGHVAVGLVGLVNVFDPELVRRLRRAGRAGRRPPRPGPHGVRGPDRGRPVPARGPDPRCGARE